MPIFVASSTLPQPIEDVFGWHERPGAMRRLTPPWEPVRIKQEAPDLTEGSRAVMELDLPGPLVPRWVARHTGYRPPHVFVDVQESGPFRRWEHHHRFESTTEGGTAMTDEVHYDLPFAKLVQPLVAARLHRMFTYRHAQLRDDLARITSAPPLQVAITGSNGSVGPALSALLTTGGHHVVAVSPDADAVVDLDRSTVTVGSRFVRIRHPQGTSLRRRLPVFAAGHDPVHWVTLDDLIGVFHHVLVNPAVTGTIEATSPNLVTGREFTATLAKLVRHPVLRPGTPPMIGAPGARTDYVFRHPLLETALRHVLGRQ